MVKRTFNCRIGGKNYELFFDNTALFEFEEHHGKPAFNVLASGELGARALTHFVYAGLLHAPEQALPLAEVKKILSPKDYIHVSGVLAQALNDSVDTGSNEGTAKNEAADQIA